MYLYQIKLIKMITNLIYYLVSTPPLSNKMRYIYIYLLASTYIGTTNEKLFPICFKRVSSVYNPLTTTLPLSPFDPQGKNNT